VTELAGELQLAKRQLIAQKCQLQKLGDYIADVLKTA